MRIISHTPDRRRRRDEPRAGAGQPAWPREQLHRRGLGISIFKLGSSV